MKIIFLSIIVFLIFTPLTGLLFPRLQIGKVSDKKFENQEKRKRENSIKNLEGFIQDQYLFRDSYINTLVYLKFKLFNKTYNENKVFFGKDGWLFLGNDYGHNIDYLKGIRKIDYDHLNNKLERFKELLFKQHNIQFFLSIAPNKISLHPEKAPSYLNSFKSTTSSSIKFSGYIDLFTPLKEYKSKCNQQIYSKTDTHWNDLGSKVALEQIVEKLNIVNKNPTKNNCFEVRVTKKRSYDLARIARLPAELMDNFYSPKNYQYNGENFKFEFTRSIKKSTIVKEKSFDIVSNINSLSNYNLLFLRDSFANSLQKVGLYDYFKTSALLHINQAKEIPTHFDKFNENILLILVVERNLSSLSPVIEELSKFYNLKL